MVDEPETNGTGTALGEERRRTAKQHRPFRAWRDEFDEFLEDMRSGALFGPSAHRRFWGQPLREAMLSVTGLDPVLDAVERDREIKIVAELPGLKESDIDLRVSNDRLTLKGQKLEDRQEGAEDDTYYLQERRFGSFSRTIPIPSGVDRDKIEAQFKNGVLTVHLPKTPEAQEQSQKIEVTSDT